MCAFVIPPGAGKLVWLGPPEQGLGVQFKMSGEQTGGAFSVIEHPIPPGAMAFPHTHQREDEFSFVLEGEVGARIGDEVVTAGPGTYILKPRGIPHAFWNSGPAPARLLEIISPPGFEQYFADMSQLLITSMGPPDPAAMDRISERYGITYSPEWLPELAAKYGMHIPGS